MKIREIKVYQPLCRISLAIEEVSLQELHFLEELVGETVCIRKFRVFGAIGELHVELAYHDGQLPNILKVLAEYC